MCIEDTWGSDIATAAALHLGAATDPARLLNVCDLSGYVHPRLAPDAPARSLGRIAPPDDPGLGITVDAVALGKPDRILD
jgi:L-alanine-DL-glutamate epimerase-like enolase superfamily enzyme